MSNITPYTISFKLPSTITDFLDFLLENRIIQIGTAFVIASQVNKLGSDFVDNIISPIVSAVFGSSDKTLKEKNITIIGIKFEIGNFFASLLKFFIFMFVFYYVFLLLGIRQLLKPQNK
jgi:large-conductance mechanosensitive channel